MRWALIVAAAVMLAGVAECQEPDVSPEPAPAAAAESTPAATQPAAESETSPPDAEASPSPDAPTEPASPVASEMGMPSDSDAAPLTPIVEDVISIDQTPDLSLPDDALVDPNALVPPDAPPPAMVVESAAERLRESTIRYREVRVKAEADANVTNLREQAEAATSLEGKRAALREYYRLLFKKIVSLDKSLKEKAEAMEEAYIRRLAQTRIEPTIPLAPPPTPEPLN